MNREIKFRAWDKINNEMIEWSKIFAYQMLYEILPNSMNEQNIYKLMEYTGLKDINDKEIYEEDIVHYISHEHECIGVIKFGTYNQDGSDGEYDPEKCLGFYIDRIKMTPEEWDDEEFFNDEYKYTKTNSILYYDIENIEVIGDIYRNPELLK